jgi:large subunit ribosomal protein L3
VSIGILGNKIGMTQVFDEKGNVIPVTVIKGGPCYITQIKTNESCGYNAVQIGYSEISANKKRLTKPMLGHFSKNKLSPFKHLKEYENNELKNYEIGQEFNVESFNVGDFVNITGLTIGKGNIGNIKRHNFSEGLKSHGSKSHRMQGSIGAGTTPGRVLPGKKMPGRTGGKQQTISGLEIIAIDKESNLLVIKGSIPGKSGNLVSIKSKN